MAVRTKADLRMLQAMPLDIKVAMTQERIRAWVNEFGEDGVCVAYSGGKDSTVLLHLVRELYPDVRAVFSNTGLEYPEIRQFAMSHDKVDIVYPDVRFVDVLTKYGYPLISKEVAEAIYYARRIGGGYTPRRNAQSSILAKKRGELAEWGGYHEVRRASLQGSLTTTGTAQPNGGGAYQKSREDGTIFTASGREILQLPQGQTQTARTPQLRSRGSKWADYPRGCLQQPRTLRRKVAV